MSLAIESGDANRIGVELAGLGQLRRGAIVEWLRERRDVEARRHDRTNVIVVEVDRNVGVPSYQSWWDVPVAEVSESDAVRAIREKYEEARRLERYFV